MLTKIKIWLLLLSCCSFVAAAAQEHTLLDQVEMIVGNKIILSSEIEAQYQQARAQGAPDNDLHCQILEQIMLEKLMVVRAEIDSVEISEDEVASEIDSRINYFLSMFGGDSQKMEEYYGRTILEMKDQFKDEVRMQLLARRMQSTITGNIKTTPAEVKAYFNKIPTDSLPYFNAEISLGELVAVPHINKAQKQTVIDQMMSLKQQIMAGEDFAKLAGKYSQDPGSAANGGDLGWVGRGQFVPEFEGAAFKLKPNELSDIIESPFGFHLIQLLERRGDKIHTRHILIKPEVAYSDLEAAKGRLDSLRQVFLKDTLTFQEMVAKFSEDEDSKKRGGNIYNPKDNTTMFEISELDPTTYFAVEGLKPGELSKPVEVAAADGAKRYRLLFVYEKTKPHRANLADDYTRISKAVENQKQQDALIHWVERFAPQTYIAIKGQYGNCEQLNRWLKKD
ncbi:MAG: peptidylprolyl isomerase [Chitinophagales bacterium]|nr:peptidylprolyl isomerase [Chitinophagales bacterium]